jgi:hypothetical protein
MAKDHTVITSILIYGSEAWPLSKKDGNLFRIFKRRILRLVYGHVNDNDVWRIRYNSEHCTLYDEPDVVSGQGRKIEVAGTTC